MLIGSCVVGQKVLGIGIIIDTKLNLVNKYTPWGGHGDRGKRLKNNYVLLTYRIMCVQPFWACPSVGAGKLIDEMRLSSRTQARMWT